MSQAIGLSKVQTRNYRFNLLFETWFSEQITYREKIYCLYKEKNTRLLIKTYSPVNEVTP